MASKGQNGSTGCPSLTAIALDKLASSIHQIHSLEKADGSGILPEELCCTLFAEVVQKGKLTPRVLEMFERTEHELLLQRIAALGIRRWTPPLQPTSKNGWLHERPSYY